MSIAPALGTGYGISAWGSTALFDNWSVTPVPAPGSAALLFYGALVARRRRGDPVVA